MHFASHKEKKLLEQQLTSQYDGFVFERTAKSKSFCPLVLVEILF